MIEDVEICLVDRDAFGARVRVHEADLLRGLEAPTIRERVCQRVAEEPAPPPVHDPQVLSVDCDARGGGAEPAPGCPTELAGRDQEGTGGVVLVDAAIAAVEHVERIVVGGEACGLALSSMRPKLPTGSPESSYW
jgi:hypothetical protein